VEPGRSGHATVLTDPKKRDQLAHGRVGFVNLASLVRTLELNDGQAVAAGRFSFADDARKACECVACP
jgi:hypothetical protein